MSFSKTTGICVLAILVHICFDATAEASAEPADFSVTTTTQHEDPRVPSGFVTRLELDDEFSKGNDLGDVLARVPGIWVRRQSSFGQPAFVAIRGGNARQVVVSIDGLRMSIPAGAGFDVGSLSIGGLDTVDIYTGPAGASRGSGALTGALDLHTSLRDDAGWSSKVTTVAGSYGTAGLEGDARWSTESLSLRLSAMGRQSDGDFDFVDAEGTRRARVNNEHRRAGVRAAAEYRTAATDLKTTASFERGTRGTPGPSEFQAAFSEARLNDQRIYATTRARQQGVVDESSLQLDLEQHVGFQEREQDYSNRDAFLGGQPVESQDTYRGYSARLASALYIGALNITHVDLDLRHETYDARQEITETRDVEANRTTVATGASTEFLLFGDRLSLLGGLRAEALEGQRSDSAFLPSAGAIVRIIKGLDLRANIAKTWRAPDFDELYLDLESVRGSADLDPERALTWDAGFVAKYKILETRAAYFENRIDTLILFLPVSSYVLEATNLQNASSRGVEAGLSLNFDDVLALEAAYTYTHARLRSSPTLQLPHRPEHVGTAGVALELGSFMDLKSLRFHVDARARSRVNLDNFASLQNPAYVTADAGVRVRPLNWLEVAVTAQNLADRQTIVDALQYPLPGRSFYASISVSGGS